jgi:hypothetical protein
MPTRINTICCWIWIKGEALIVKPTVIRLQKGWLASTDGSKSEKTLWNKRKEITFRRMNVRFTLRLRQLQVHVKCERSQVQNYRDRKYGMVARDLVKVLDQRVYVHP